VPEIIWQLSQQVAARRRRHHHDGHAGRRLPAQPGDKIECGVDGVGTLKVNIGNPE
jgi:fumarylpyruvate hydrolase